MSASKPRPPYRAEFEHSNGETSVFRFTSQNLDDLRKECKAMEGKNLLDPEKDWDNLAVYDADGHWLGWLDEHYFHLFYGVFR